METERKGAQMKKLTRRLLSLAAALCLMAGSLPSVMAQDGLTVKEAYMYSALLRGELAPVEDSVTGLTNVSQNVGRILFDVAPETVDPTTLRGNVSMVKTADGTPVEIGVDAVDGGQKIAVTFGTLDLGTEYTITLESGIQNAAGTDNLAEYSLTFTTTGTPYIYQQNFDGIEAGTQGQTLRDALSSMQIMFPAAFGSEIGTFAVEELDGGNVLHVRSGNNLSAANNGRIDMMLNLTKAELNENGSPKIGNGIRTGFVYETTIRMDAWDTQINMGNYVGDGYADALRMWPYGGGTLIHAQTFAEGSDTPTSIPLVSDITAQTVYKLRLVYRPAENGAFLTDVYWDNGNGFQLVKAGIRTQADAGKPGRIDTMRLISINGDKGGNFSEAYFDDMKVYNYLPVLLMDSNIKNVGAVSADTRAITLKFNTDMDAASFAGQVQMNGTALTGIYDAGTRTWKADMPAGTLADNTDYTLTIGNIYGSEGQVYSGEKQIIFTTGQSGAPAEGFAVTEQTLHSTLLSGSRLPILNGETGVAPTVGKILFTVQGNVDPLTVSSASVTMKKADGTSVRSGSFGSGSQIAVSFGKLQENTTYTISLTDRIQSAGGEALEPYSLTFTTGKEQEFYAEDFETMTVSEENAEVKAELDSRHDNAVVDKFDQDVQNLAIREDEDGQQYLYIKTGSKDSYNTGRVDQTVTFAGGIRTGFVYDIQARFRQWGAQINLGPVVGTGAADGSKNSPAGLRLSYNDMQNTMFHAGHFPKGSAQTLPTNEPVITNVNSQTTYQVRMVFRVADFGGYLVDVYCDMNDGNGYQLMKKDLRFAASDEDILRQVNSMRVLSLNGRTSAGSPEGDCAEAEIDSIRVYPYTPVSLLNASIQDMEQDIDPNIKTFSLTFSEDMRIASFVNSITLTNTVTGEKSALTGDYNEESHTFTADLRESKVNTLADETQYTITIGDVAAAESGLALEGKNTITFTTGVNTAISSSGTVVFRENPGEIPNPDPVDQGGEGMNYELKNLQTLTGAKSVYPVIPVSKNAAEQSTVFVSIALYDSQNRLKRAEAQTVDISNTELINTVGMTNLETEKGDLLKVFVFDSLEGMKPVLANAPSLEDDLSAGDALKNYAPWADKDELNIVYLGGSITQGAQATAGYKSWVGRTSAMFEAAFPDKTVHNINAGIGGTGSDYGLFRLYDDVISKNPDLVFVEFAVNDQTADPAESQKCMEGIVRNLLSLDEPPLIIFVYTTTNQFVAFDTVHQQVADYYDIPSINLQSYMKEMVDNKEIQTADFLRDGTHPNDYGYYLYAKYIIDKLNDPDNYLRPATWKEEPMRTDYYPYTGKKITAANATRKTGNWAQDTVIPTSGNLATAEAGATLEFEFEGNFVGLMHRIGNSYGNLEIYIDDVKQDVTRAGITNPYLDCYYGSVTSSQSVMWFKTMGLSDGPHTLKLVATGEKNDASAGNKVSVDYIYVKR